MKVSDYIVEYLIEKQITDVFGYPGGMITHLLDSFSKYKDKISSHITYNEQGAAFAACGYAQVSGKPGVAYATSGPGATNLITGICNAYMDSIATVFITGQVNSYEQKKKLKVRQCGFQETDIVSMVSGVTKYAAQVNSVESLKWNLDYAFYIATTGRKGPVLLDIAMDVTKMDINPLELQGYSPLLKVKNKISDTDKWLISDLIKSSSRPVLLLGNGVDRYHDKQWIKKIDKLGVPVVSSMLAVDIKSRIKNFYGFIGTYGNRAANFIIAKCDLLIAVGTRLDIRQVGIKRDNFAPNAKIVRVDIDAAELEYKVHSNEYSYCVDAKEALEHILESYINLRISYEKWIETCDQIFNSLDGLDDNYINKLIMKISHATVDNTMITTDVGQNQIWIAQSFDVKEKQRIFFSGGHGAMGYSLPASIGAYAASRRIVYSFNGDGGIQMNIQELQTISQERMPIKIFVFNNNALGMIRQFQKTNFNSNFFHTTNLSGFGTPDFKKIAEAYMIDYKMIEKVTDIESIGEVLKNDLPALIEIKIPESTYVYPKLEFGKPTEDQEPLLDRSIYNYLMKL